MFQDICIYLEARGPTEDFEHFKAIEIFDDVMVSLVQEGRMQRFLPCNACLALGKDRYFVEVGPGFEPRDEMEICQGVNGDSLGDEKQHYMDEKQKSLISTIPPVVAMNQTFSGGIQGQPLKPLREIEEGLKVGDQIWINRDRSSHPYNPVARLMPYCHVVVYVGDEHGQKKVIHVTSASFWDGKLILTATIKEDFINAVINPDDLGKKYDVFLYFIFVVSTCPLNNEYTPCDFS